MNLLTVYWGMVALTFLFGLIILPSTNLSSKERLIDDTLGYFLSTAVLSLIWPMLVLYVILGLVFRGDK